MNSWLGRPTFRTVQIEAAGLRDKEARKTERRVKRLFNDCGCAITALIFLSAGGLLGAYLELVSDFTWTRLAMMLVASALAAVAAKLAALFVSQWRLGRILQDLHTNFITTATETGK
jgi:membrane protein DedA with SNARE-associated domain